jgi:type I restriction enzyme S subunit
MDVKPGYKQTEVGMIPDDWETRLVHEIATIKTGPFGTLLKASEYSQVEGVPLISVGEIREGFLRITDHTPCIPEVIIRRLPQYVLRKGDIVFGRKGGVDRSALIQQSQDGWFLGSDGISIRPTQDCSHEYVSFQLQSARVQGWLLQNSIGTTMPSLNQEILRNVVITFPPTKAEQRAIAAALSDVDALIAALDRLIAKKRDIKQAAMQELLTGKRRLPGFKCGKGYKHTEVGVIPADWDVRTLQDICRVIVDGTHFTPKYVNDGIPFYSVENVTANNFSDTKFISQKEHAELTKRCKPEKDDILLTRIGSLGDTKLIDWNVDASIYVSLALLKLGKIANPNYVYQYTKFRQFVQDIEKRSLMNATPKKINMGNIGIVPIPLPPTLKEQCAISEVLSDMDAEIAALEARRDKTRALKQGMMQELLTGRIRLV